MTWPQFGDRIYSDETTWSNGDLWGNHKEMQVFLDGEWQAVGKVPSQTEKRIKWPFPERREMLPHPRRFLDGEVTRCPDCGAVTHDPSVLLQIPCKVVTPEPRGINMALMDKITVHMPEPTSVGFTWFNPSEQICWVWSGGIGEKEDWSYYDAETGVKKPFSALLHPPKDYHGRSRMLVELLDVKSVEGLPGLDAATKHLTHKLILQAQREGMVLLQPPQISTTGTGLMLGCAAIEVFTT